MLQSNNCSRTVTSDRYQVKSLGEISLSIRATSITRGDYRIFYTSSASYIRHVSGMSRSSVCTELANIHTCSVCCVPRLAEGLGLSQLCLLDTFFCVDVVMTSKPEKNPITQDIGDVFFTSATVDSL
jgi:hypothetical protein